MKKYFDATNARIFIGDRVSYPSNYKTVYGTVVGFDDREERVWISTNNGEYTVNPRHVTICNWRSGKEGVTVGDYVRFLEGKQEICGLVIEVLKSKRIIVKDDITEDRWSVHRDGVVSVKMKPKMESKTESKTEPKYVIARVSNNPYNGLGLDYLCDKQLNYVWNSDPNPAILYDSKQEAELEIVKHFGRREGFFVKEYEEEVKRYKEYHEKLVEFNDQEESSLANKAKEMVEKYMEGSEETEETEQTEQAEETKQKIKVDTNKVLGQIREAAERYNLLCKEMGAQTGVSWLDVAANEIERLQKENQELRKELESVVIRLTMLLSSLDRDNQ